MPWRRLAAAGGVAGPVAFAAGWIAGGAGRPGYSPVSDAVSRLAAIGTTSRPAMTAGFVGFGLSVPLYAVALRTALPGRAWMAAAATGVATLGVAAAPLGRSVTGDRVHAAVAVAGYITLAATPLLAAGPLSAAGHRRAARWSRGAGVVAAGMLAASGAGPATGALQRAGLSVGHLWVAASGAWLVAATPPVAGASR